jgi:CDP-glucose 4,6-dehydratase
MESLVNPGRFWAGRRVFLTGHTGFKGSWLALWLHALGSRVAGYALAPDTEPSLYVQARVDALVESTEADVRDGAALRRAVAAARPEVVIHLAAQAQVRQSYREPVHTFATNVMGTAHLLEAVREVGGVKAVLVVTSDKCYDNPGHATAFTEDDRLGGHDPYSSSKACAELVAAAYRASFFDGVADAPALATARAGNVIGGGDWSTERLVPDLLRAFTAGVPARLRHPQSVRPWQHVLEPLRGYLLLAERLCSGGPGFATAYNFGPARSDGRTVAWVADELAARWGGAAGWQPQGGPQPHEAQQLQLDTARARQALAWKPVLTLEEALVLTVAWSRDWAAGADARALTLAQIAAYQARLEADDGR